jgi:macrolide-specific efflux system membrane fusion protein
MSKKKIIWIVIIIALIVGSVYYSKTKKTKIQYTTETAKKGDLKQTVSVTGNVVSAGQIDLAFKTGGKIVSMYVNVGDKVVAGQKIAEIDKGTLKDQLASAKEEISYQKNMLYDMKTPSSTSGPRQRDAQRANIKKAQAAYAGIVDQIDDTVLVAPQDGIVVKKNFDEGETVAMNAAVVALAGNEDLEIQAKVPESDINKVSVGQKSSATFDALPADQNIMTEVYEIEPVSTVIQDVVYYIVKLKLPTQDARLKNGMSSDIDIETAMRPSVIMIPLRAVKTDGNTKYVDVLNDDGLTTRRANVETGLQGDEGMVEIKSGLSGGEKVVTLMK